MQIGVQMKAKKITMPNKMRRRRRRKRRMRSSRTRH